MMTEISLNILDIAENSIRASASLVTIDVTIDTAADRLRVFIGDDGCGMTPEQLAHAEDPFFTTRTTRKVGLGIPFFKMAAESAGGDFSIWSRPGKGTIVQADFGLSHIDRMPLGDICGTIHTLIVFNPGTDFLFTYTYDQKSFHLDTREFREILGDVPFDVPEVSRYIADYLKENKQETDQGAIL
ncbi:MAG: ATP-binding protein [Lachnospiraceae bacterium]|nr:ATP-binding protein [Oscillospiraceae bacterium]MDY5539812.1 ATP-binding protein [Lachnospiraceae bacterium]MDY5649077.1 ATP-binding protein [Lachnospiraceae bacterium]